MDAIERKRAIGRIRRDLRKNGLTLNDVGVEGPLTKVSDEILMSLLEDIDEENAREAGRRYEEEESLRQMADDN